MLDSGHQHCLTALRCRRFVADFPLHDSDGFPLRVACGRSLGRRPLTELAAAAIRMHRSKRRLHAAFLSRSPRHHLCRIAPFAPLHASDGNARGSFSRSPRRQKRLRTVGSEGGAKPVSCRPSWRAWPRRTQIRGSQVSHSQRMAALPSRWARSPGPTYPVCRPRFASLHQASGRGRCRKKSPPPSHRRVRCPASRER